MELHFYNTLSRQKELFKSIENKKVGMYSCGPTVYNFAHIGNLRAYVFADTLKRVLNYNGYEVNHIVNITDVGHLTSDEDAGEDKIESGAKRENKSVWEIAKFYENAFYDDLKLLNILPATKYPKATEHIKEMIEFIKRLEGKGFTYTAGGNVYFDTSKFEDYGKMARLNLDPEAIKSRVEADLNKKNPFDFVLWFTEYKYKNHEMLWDSPWGEGFPGWHIECSAMATKYLGDQIDIHTGGIDHISVHHTNEIAQSEAAFGHKWVSFWMHNDFLVEKLGEKMAKSAGEFLRLKVLTDKGYSPLDYRYYLLTGHYRSQLQFSWEALDSARNSLKRAKNKIFEFQKSNYAVPAGRQESGIMNHEIATEHLEHFMAAVNDDLNTSVALSVMWKTLDSEEINANQKLELMKKYDEVLGLGLLKDEKETISSEIIELAEKRKAARKEGDWAKSDKLRDEILNKGYEVKDTPSGYEISQK